MMLESKENACRHEWVKIDEKCSCSVYDSRGVGQYNDPCYGASCPCSGNFLTVIYRCRVCGKETTQQIS